MILCLQFQYKFDFKDISDAILFTYQFNSTVDWNIKEVVNFKVFFDSKIRISRIYYFPKEYCIEMKKNFRLGQK